MDSGSESGCNLKCYLQKQPIPSIIIGEKPATDDQVV